MTRDKQWYVFSNYAFYDMEMQTMISQTVQSFIVLHPSKTRFGVRRL